MPGPRVIDGMLEERQLETSLDLIRRHLPWDLIRKRHFRSLDELEEMPDPKIRVAFAMDPEGHTAELVEVVG